MTALLCRLQWRIERNCLRLGVTYPWWIPAYSSAAYLTLAGISYVQRGAFTAPWTVQLALVVVLLPTLSWLRGWLVLPWLKAGLIMIGVVLFLTQPQSVDFAPLIPMILAGEIGATTSTRRALLISVAEIAILIGAAHWSQVDGVSLYVFGVAVGVDVGIVMRWQMRALAAERANSSMLAEQAMLAERQRIAREIHDVVGHTLSINLLHVTAARHALQQHADIADAVESLVAAEQVGRAAMSDLRRTVSMLNTGPAETRALPGAADVLALVENSRAAGLAVDYECHGNLGEIDPALGLGLYRVVQESLANIAKHAPQAPAQVRVSVTPELATVSVRNPLPRGTATATAGGSGLPGMAARAKQLGARLRTGADGGEWAVELALPLVVDARASVAAERP